MMNYSCEICGEPFEASPAAKRKFCSRACMGISKSRQVERTCQTCGKSFSVKQHKVKDGRGLYCSRECADTGWDEPCENCGTAVHRAPFHAGRFENVFCSRGCYGEWKRDAVECTCVQCGKDYITKPSRADKYDKSFCSRACYFESIAKDFVELTCIQCGGAFNVPGASLNPHMYQGKYCSNECRGLARRVPDARRSEYNHEFTDKLKEQIRKRGGRMCQSCGIHTNKTRRKLDVHHIDYDKTNNHPSNLIALCDSCHSRTNYNRDTWQNHYESLMKSRKLDTPK